MKSSRESPVQPVEELMLLVVRTCERLRLSYYVTGSIASMAWGESRLTLDVDVVVELPSWNVREFCEAFPAPEYYVSQEAAMAAARGPSQFNIIWPSKGVKADIMVFKPTPFDESRLSRARRVEIPDVGQVMIAAPEDIILKKLEFFKEGGSDKHPRDIASILKVRGSELDFAYIELWASRIGVQKEWQMVRASVEPHRREKT